MPVSVHRLLASLNSSLGYMRSKESPTGGTSPWYHFFSSFRVLLCLFYVESPEFLVVISPRIEQVHLFIFLEVEPRSCIFI